MIQIHIYQDDAIDEVVETEAEIEVDVWRLRYAIA